METLDVIRRKINQIEWEKNQTKRVNEYRKEYHKQPSFITEKNPHCFSHEELLSLTSNQLTICNVVKELCKLT